MKKDPTDKPEDNSVSLNKYISSSGICSRREADRRIEAGRVSLNGVTARKGNRVSPGDTVKMDGKALSSKPTQVYLALNKPPGIVCTTDRNEPANIIDFVGYPERLFHVGRLDKFSEGLIFLTNDGDIVNKILRAGNRHEKEYIVTVRQRITRDFIRKMSGGLPLPDTVTRRCKTVQLDEYTFKIILTQGLNRQIRRMCEYLGYEVKTLRRVRIMNVRLGRLPLGRYRELTPTELQKMNKMIAASSKTEEASRDRRKKNFHKKS